MTSLSQLTVPEVGLLAGVAGLAAGLLIGSQAAPLVEVFEVVALPPPAGTPDPGCGCGG